MGYTTDFNGEFAIEPTLDHRQVTYLIQLNETRRYRRDSELTAERPDPIREAVGLPVGNEGEYFVGEGGMRGQSQSIDCVEYNQPPRSQPSLWLQWRPTEDGKKLEWDGGEKFYQYVEWLQYLIDHFFEPWGKKLNGKVSWEGESSGDLGKIVVEDNRVRIYEGQVQYFEVLQ